MRATFDARIEGDPIDQPITQETLNQWEREIDQFVSAIRARLGQGKHRSYAIAAADRNSDDNIDAQPVEERVVPEPPQPYASPAAIDNPLSMTEVEARSTYGESSESGEPLDRLQQLKRKIAQRLQNP